MFDIGFAELVLLMLVGLLVLGPEKLPRVARDVGLYLRKARRAWNQMRHSIEQELDATEMRRALQETQESAQAAVDELKKSVNPESSVPKTGKGDGDDG